MNNLDDNLLAAFKVLGAICHTHLGCGFITTIKDADGGDVLIDSRLSNVDGVEFVSLEQTGQRDDRLEFDSTHS